MRFSFLFMVLGSKNVPIPRARPLDGIALGNIQADLPTPHEKHPSPPPGDPGNCPVLT